MTAQLVLTAARTAGSAAVCKACLPIVSYRRSINGAVQGGYFLFALLLHAQHWGTSFQAVVACERAQLSLCSKCSRTELFRILTALELTREQKFDELLRRIFISTQFTCGQNTESSRARAAKSKAIRRGGVWWLVLRLRRSILCREHLNFNVSQLTAKSYCSFLNLFFSPYP